MYHWEIVFRKKTTFGRATNRKWQIKINGIYKVVSRVGTGLYKLLNVLTSEHVILSGDQLIRSRLSEEEAKTLYAELTDGQADD